MLQLRFYPGPLFTHPFPPKAVIGLWFAQQTNIPNILLFLFCYLKMVENKCSATESTNDHAHGHAFPVREPAHSDRHRWNYRYARSKLNYSPLKQHSNQTICF